MTLYTAHKILIGAAIGLGAVLLLHGLSQYRETGSGDALATGIGGAAFAVALAFYLRWFLAKRRGR